MFNLPESCSSMPEVVQAVLVNCPKKAAKGTHTSSHEPEATKVGELRLLAELNHLRGGTGGPRACRAASFSTGFENGALARHSYQGEIRGQCFGNSHLAGGHNLVAATKRK